ncbi:MAG TPA: hypothetical protein VMP03_00995 [Methylomirabilota bacterium]|nr:hypothetical protein [Methylomirabilota bacterium]
MTPIGDPAAVEGCAIGAVVDGAAGVSRPGVAVESTAGAAGFGAPSPSRAGFGAPGTSDRTGFGASGSSDAAGIGALGTSETAGAAFFGGAPAIGAPTVAWASDPAAGEGGGGTTAAAVAGGEAMAVATVVVTGVAKSAAWSPAASTMSSVGVAAIFAPIAPFEAVSAAPAGVRSAMDMPAGSPAGPPVSSPPAASAARCRSNPKSAVFALAPRPADGAGATGAGVGAAVMLGSDMIPRWDELPRRRPLQGAGQRFGRDAALIFR